jgi:hypothetical protein
MFKRPGPPGSIRWWLVINIFVALAFVSEGAAEWWAEWSGLRLALLQLLRSL